MPRNKTLQNEAAKQADELLARIGKAKAEYEKVNRQWDAAIKELERQYGQRAREAKEQVRALEKQLVKHAKKHRIEVFGDRDRADLSAGALIWSVIRRVKRKKDVSVDRLKELGFTDGIKVVESVFWDRLETWPDEKLIAAGTERVTKESVEYELKE